MFDLPSIASAVLFVATCVQIACMAPKKSVGKQVPKAGAAKAKAAAKGTAKAKAAAASSSQEEMPAPTTPGDDVPTKNVKDEMKSPARVRGSPADGSKWKRVRGNPLDKSALIKLRNGLKSWLKGSDEKKREAAQRQLDVLDSGSHSDRQDLVESFLMMGSSLRGEAALKWATSYQRENIQIKDESSGQATSWRTLEGILTANDLTIMSFSSADKAFKWAEYEAMECLKREGVVDNPEYQPKLSGHPDPEFARASSKYWYKREMESTMTTHKQESKRLKGVTHGNKMDGWAMQVALSDNGPSESSDGNRAAAEHSCRVSKTSGA